MARMAAEDGITHVVCTPHASGNFGFEPEVVGAKLQEVRAALAAEGVSITLGSGCDFHLNYENIQDAIEHPDRYTINGKNYLLVELPDFGLSPGLGETFYQLQLAGMTPILTHPERNPVLQRDPARMASWIRHGLLVQVTAGSLLGHMGRTAERMAHKLLADRWVHFLATDAHNLTSRKPRMTKACELVAQRYGAAYAQRLCTDNPLAVFEGRHLGPQDEPQHVYDDYSSHGKGSWWKRLFAS